jgi:hypothetical protein
MIELKPKIYTLFVQIENNEINAEEALISILNDFEQLKKEKKEKLNEKIKITGLEIFEIDSGVYRIFLENGEEVESLIVLVEGRRLVYTEDFLLNKEKNFKLLSDIENISYLIKL